MDGPLSRTEADASQNETGSFGWETFSPDWNRRVESLLYEGERIESTVGLASARVVVTSHRLLAFTPESDGANFHQVDRPNVVGVDVETVGDPGKLVLAIKPGLAGVVLLAVSQWLTLASLFDASVLDGVDTSAPGIDTVASTLALVTRILALLDLAILLSGVVLTIAALGLVGLYVHSRERRFVVEVAGDEDVHVPSFEGDGGEYVVTLREALAGHSNRDGRAQSTGRRSS